jgi:general secretion pathway protein D
MLEEALREYRARQRVRPDRTGRRRQGHRRSSGAIRDQAEAAQPRRRWRSSGSRRARRGAARAHRRQRTGAGLRIANASLRDTLNFIGMATGINVTYEGTLPGSRGHRSARQRDARAGLNQLMSSNQLFYKVVNSADDHGDPGQRAEARAVRRAGDSHVLHLARRRDRTGPADQHVIRLPAMAVQPQIVANKTSNTVTVRATTGGGDHREDHRANDNPRAEVVIDVQVLEVNRTRAKTFGLNLSRLRHQRDVLARSARRRSRRRSNPPFNLNTISRGVSTADFYLAVPSAVVRFLESDSETKLIAKPSCAVPRGRRSRMDLGDEIPVPSTVFTPIAQGGANTNPLTSFNYRTVGITIEMTPRVTPEGDVILDLLLENSTRGQDVNVAGQNLRPLARGVSTRDCAEGR